MIVQLARAVETQPYVKIFLGEKLTPLFINGRAVGLNPIDDFFAFGEMLLLERHRFAEKFHAQQCGLAAMPGEADDFFRGRLNMLDDVAFEGRVVEAKVCAFGIKIFFFQIIAVVTIEVANRPDRLDHNLKLACRSLQRATPDETDQLFSWTLLKKQSDVITCVWTLWNPVPRLSRESNRQ
jgi:hypothetical protein